MENVNDKHLPAQLDRNTYYPAFKAHDVRFDGRAFVGVASTGIYCRPVCRARTPKKENCTFYGTAAAAEAAGYRPCLKCRPELAPGFSSADAAGTLARRAALMMEENSLCGTSLEELAGALGVSGRHLRRVFFAQFGVSPIQYLQTSRLLLAKSLLTDTSLPVTDIAYAAGFGSVRRLNALFSTHYRMPPSALRRQEGPANAASGDAVTLFIGYRPPYRWEALLAFLAARAVPGTEAVRENAYHRTAAVRHGAKTCHGWLTVQNAASKNALAVTVSASLLPVLSTVLARVKHLFDTQCDPAEIYTGLSGMNTLREGFCQPGTRLPGCFDPFEMAVRAILGQQVTLKAAKTLAARLVRTFGQQIATPVEGLTHLFPAAEAFCALDGPPENHLGPLGVTKVRARAIYALAAAVTKGDINLSRSGDPPAQTQKLQALPGFGTWTAQYIAMRALGWPDAFPHTDCGIKAVLKGHTPKDILALAEAWRPWRAYAAINLWNSHEQCKKE